MAESIYPPPIRSGFLSARAVVPRPRRGGRGVAPANPSRMPSERKGRDDRVYLLDLGPFTWLHTHAARQVFAAARTRDSHLESSSVAKPIRPSRCRAVGASWLT